MGSAAASYGYAGWSTQQDEPSSGKRSRSR
jgi:hypothetical protein